MVVGTGEAALVARAIGAVHTTCPDELAPPPTGWLVWGPIDFVHELRSQAPGSHIAWRVAGLDLPLAERDHRALASIDRIIVGDAVTQDLLGDHGPRCVVIESLPTSATHWRPTAGEVPTGPTVVIAADAHTVGGALVSMKQMLDGGLRRCDSCGRAEAAAFDPSCLGFAEPTSCGCGGHRVRLAPPQVNWVVAIRGDDDAGATAMCAWLEIADRVAVVAEADLVIDEADVVVDTSTSVDQGWGTGLAMATGAGLITAAMRCGAESATVGTRTESDADGRVRHTMDPVDLHRVLTDRLRAPRAGVGGTDIPPRGRSSMTDAEIVDAWSGVVDELVNLEPRPAKSRRLRSLPSGWRQP